MEDQGIIRGSLNLDYVSDILHSICWYFLEKTTKQMRFCLIRENSYVTVAHITTGKFNIFCKVRAKTINTLKILFS